MSNIKNYVIPLEGVSANDPAALKALLEDNSSLFDSAILSTYGGDIRYAVIDDSFTVTNLADGQIKYSSKIHYFAPCNDQNDIFEAHGSANYTIIDEVLTLTLDETVWNVE